MGRRAWVVGMVLAGCAAGKTDSGPHALGFGAAGAAARAALPAEGLGSTFTVSAWVALDPSLPGTDLPVLVADDGFALWVAADGLAWFGADAATDTGVYATADLRDGAPHHLLGLWDGDSAELYVDGVLAGLHRDTGLAGAGALTVGAWPRRGVVFAGLIDDIHLQTGLHPPDDEAPPAGPAALGADTVRLWAADEGAGRFARDAVEGADLRLDEGVDWVPFSPFDEGR